MSAGIDQCVCGANLAVDNNGMPHQCPTSSPIQPMSNTPKIDELLDSTFTKLELVEIGEDGNNTYREVKPFKSQIAEAKDQLYQLLMEEVIGEDEKILELPEPIQGVDQLWLEGRAQGEFSGKTDLRAQQRTRLNKLFGKE